ncbi:MAG: DUF4837 family protein [Prevotellaceae bacterium]|jgi:hypothetical protein|nr:DUF4837 family protein [Prevotellaceae bacterium]
MKTNVCLIVYSLIVALSFSACKGKGSAFQPTSTGAPYEVLVVIDLGMWERPAGRAIYNALDADMIGLPQSEPWFKIMYTSPGNFDSFLKPVRNIIVVDVNKNAYTQAKYVASKNVYAAPQAVLTIQAPTEDALETFVNEHKQAMLDYFTRAEINAQLLGLESSHSMMVEEKVKSMFGYDIWAPTSLQYFKTGKNFLWASTNTAMNDMNLVIYSYPYTDKRTFTKDFLVHKRDSVMGKNLPGSYENSFMSTDSRTVTVKSGTMQNAYFMEIRGLWRMTGNDFMGGPFVSYTRIDEVNQRVVTAELFIYSPNRNKRRLVRTMEATLASLRLPSEQQRPQLTDTITTPTNPNNTVAKNGE